MVPNILFFNLQRNVNINMLIIIIKFIVSAILFFRSFPTGVGWEWVNKTDELEKEEQSPCH